MAILEIGKYFLTSLVFTFFLLPVFIKLLEKYQILESPGHRKVHKFHTPSMGGVPIFLGFGICILIWWSPYMIYDYKLLLGAILLTFILGLRDDLIPMKATHKLFSQMIPSFMIAMTTGGLITSFYGLFGPWQFPSVISIIITLFTITVIINSINLIDGADGLAGGIGSLGLLFYSAWFYLIGETQLAIIAVSFLGAVSAFLYFNWMPSKIFMGDTGALMIGLMLSFFTIQFLNANYALSESNPYRFQGSIGTSFCVLIIPLFDTLRVFIIRVMKGLSPFTPDKNHIHHVLMRKGFTHSQLTITLIAINIMFIGLAIVMNSIPDYITIPVVLILGLIFNLILDFSGLSFALKRRKIQLKTDK